MEKIKLGVIFGGTSTEHDVSIVSGTSVLRNLSKEKYETYPIYIDKNGNWSEYRYNNETLKIGDTPETSKQIENICEYLRKLDVVFPVMHGLKGEDGTIQGLLELLGVKYVGSKVLGSSICMDKAYAKIIFEKAKIDQAKYVYIRKCNDSYIYIKHDFTEQKMDIDNLTQRIEQEISYPMFIKPSNSGSSVGINKANNIEELKHAIEYASKFDKKILIEENIEAREIECAVLGNEEVEASILGEIKPADEFYSYDAKYNNKESKTLIPAELTQQMEHNIQEIAKKAYKAADCKGFARIDFFIDDKNNKIYINEINTIPGFTEISMYPKLWEASGLPYTNLLDRLIDLALM